MKIIYLTFASVVLSMFIVNKALAQIDTIDLHSTKLNTSHLNPGIKQYLVLSQLPSSPKTLKFWYWIREVRKENYNGADVFTIKQHWYGSDSSSYREIYSVSLAKNFTPLYHSETIKGIKKAYNWSETAITGADSVAANAAAGFNLKFKDPNFNWNLDIETFEMLPFASGKQFAISFYYAGLGPPKYVLYKVIGSESLATIGAEKVDCWKLFYETDRNGSHYTETFWIAKEGHEFLKEEDTFPGGYRYKIKISVITPDIVGRFDRQRTK